MYRTYRLLRGSSTYNAEIARLIDGLVHECIEDRNPRERERERAEIATPEEKRILEERYGVKFG